MDILAIKAEIDRLVDELKPEAARYHLDAAPQISDGAYDKAYRRLVVLEAEYPNLVRKDSPTQSVEPAPEADNGLAKVEHIVPMQSLNNSFTDIEMKKALEAMAAELGIPVSELEFAIEYKMDGLAVALRYKFGLLDKGVTRGIGTVGDDITHNVAEVPDVVKLVPHVKDLEYFEVRGESYLRHDNFDFINSSGVRKGKAYVNPRNASAGIMRKHEVIKPALERMSFGAYSIASDDGDQFATQAQAIEFLKAGGFDIPFFRVVKGIEGVQEAYDEIYGSRADIPFDIDGMVIKVNDKAHQATLGFRSNSPRWALARKFPPQEEFTVVEDVTIDTGRTGAISFTAALKPVFVGGVTVSSSTLHNMDEIRRLDLKIGDKVTLVRRGDVIPKIIAVHHDARTGAEIEIVEPTTCPHCGSVLQREKDAVIQRCVNKRGCPVQALKLLTYAVSIDVLNIKNFGAKLVEGLYEKGLINTVPDIFKLTDDDLLSGGCERGNLAKVVKSIEKARSMPFDLLLASLGIQEIGRTASKALAVSFKSVEEVIAADYEGLRQVEGFGKKMPNFVLSFFEKEINKETLRDYERNGVKIVHIEKVTEGPLLGQTWAISGSMTQVSRADAKKHLESLGAKVAGSVSKKTTRLVAGPGAGDKLASATDNGVDVWDEDKLIEMLKQYSVL
ncbi:NAD-dependent DNA ligase LigA [Pseudomonas viridiflava]|nr:NAD-dependent DNA ligase LigA [Pseudomonas viridiflava]